MNLHLKHRGFNPWRGLACLVAIVCLASASLNAEVPRPEHPRPDAFRANWATLNGEWQFEIDSKADGEARGLITGKDLSARIIVPFCPESKLSGIGNTALMTNVWYRRTFEVPAAMKGQRVRLHFGGVDYKTWVWVNGQSVGSHVGGSAAFNFEITKALRPGANELVVKVFDDTASAKQPAGKQSFGISEGCVYTRTTGIWQSVWIEAVGSSFVENFSITSDPDHSRVLIEVGVNGADPDLTLTAEAFADGKRVGYESSPAQWRNQRLVVNLSRKTLWEPGAPFLYDLKFTLRNGVRKVDEVTSYFGLRKVAIDGRSILINGKRVFQRLILDQGFYPDGIWTAPSDAALKHDIQMSLDMGYNGARLHQKVFEPRFLYWADKMGYLVWGEFPNWGYNYQPENYANYINEWTEVLLRDRNHPSIIGWCPFNETPGQAGEIQQIVWHETKAIDPTRPILETSGWSHSMQNVEVRDDHDYNQNPAAFKQRWMEFFTDSGSLPAPARYSTGAGRREIGVPFMVSEFGGTVWGDRVGGWGYGEGPKDLEGFYTRYEGLVGALLDNPNMFGFCYTQLTDVEQEHNGLYFYDRKPKFDAQRMHAITARKAAFEITGPTARKPAAMRQSEWRVVVGSAVDGALSKPYRNTTQAPAANWTEAGFDDAAWQTAPAPFGTVGKFRTPWKTSDLWLRQTFQWDGVDFKEAALAIFHDEDTDVYVNGKKIWNRAGFNNSYEFFRLGDALKKAMKKGDNTLAVHTHQTEGGQFIDLALLVAK
jgi:hypothetical protein